ncbi:TnsA-like heteromeric transposase endonuclease subunit [Mycolicibacterium iranicum]|uniref:TnsA-like heteromeric transposase endonuclease subunit n=1 Tax=Mycolicibacterium iranicum TaxID=912594 RepID=A0ABT4HET7_MYCIR|nr:TnsA-like heteromeric transposase endonuclease subunit [Mycolicibacterium iranicum]MCZ0728366.1 TnsA-like heteromeric transposase endonuclease subunit [Mycolicibacterium iranicum]
MAKSSLRLFPRNMTDTTRVLTRLDGSVRNDSASTELAALRTEQALPIRQFFSWPGKRNYEGVWWSSSNRGHVEFESLLEREFLLTADADIDVVAIAAQPLALLWPHGTPGERHHVPDFFVRLASGDGRLVDVRAPDRVAKNAEQFAMTRAVCSEIGWQYEVFTGLPPTRAQNLRWLAGYRHDRHAPTSDTTGAIQKCFATTMALRTGIIQSSAFTGLPPDVTTAHVLHLLWRGRLLADLNTPLSMASEVWA